MSGAVPGLPGAAPDAGTGPAVTTLFEGLLCDAGAADATRVPDALPAHLTLLAGPHGHLVESLLVPLDAAAPLLSALSPGATGLRVVLTTAGYPTPVEGPAPATALGVLAALRDARGDLLADGRLDVTGVVVPPLALPGGTGELLEILDLGVTARLDVRAGDPAASVRAIARDGAEDLALPLAGPAGARASDAAAAATLLREAVDRDVTVHVSSGVAASVTAEGPSAGPGLLNVLCAVRAALNGAEAPELTAILTGTAVAPLASAVRRMSDADAAVLRAFLGSYACPDVPALVAELDALGLLEPEA